MRSTLHTARTRRRFSSRRVLAASLLPASLALGGCVSSSARPAPVQRLHAAYSTPLVEVARPAVDSTAPRGGVTTRLGDSLRYVYADSVVEIHTAMLTDRVALAITNRTDEPITVVWSDAAFADYEGEPGAVLRAGGRRPRHGRAQPPSVIRARRTLVDAVLPATRVVKREGREGPFGWRRGGWDHAPLIAAASATLSAPPGSSAAADQRAAFVASVQAMMGKRVGVVLPMRHGGTTTAYTLWFTVNGAAVVDSVE